MKRIMKRLLSTTLLLDLVILTCLFCHVQTLCQPDEGTALLQFKDSFVISRTASADPLAYPKVASWSPKEKDDCCSWDGVECDENNNHVMTLDLSSSCLYGSFTSNNSLFRLSNLQALNLADNDFNGSEIPSQFSNLLKLRYLNLSLSAFTGQIPSEISKLSNLSYLDLSSNNNLELKQPNFSTLIRNFGKLKHLDLTNVDISSRVPDILAKFSCLMALLLDACGLCGEFPSGIFQLPNLQLLSLSGNKNLTGSLPEFCSGNPLRELWLWDTGLSGHIPSSIGKLDSLHVLNIARSRFSGPIPYSLGKLFNLRSLNLNRNYLNGTVDFNIFLNMGNLTRLLLENNLTVLISESSTMGNTHATLPKLEVLNLGNCHLTRFPSFLRYQEKLKYLDLGKNHIRGQVPKWIWNTSIEALRISDNFFTSFGIDVLPSQSLRTLDFSINNFTGAIPVPPPTTTLFYGALNELSGEIPPIFFNLSSLKLLDLSYNKLSGVLPKCSRNINHNLSSARVPQMCQFGSQLQGLDLSYNQLQGQLPPSLLANCMELRVLKLENNHFNDDFPSWLGTLPKLKLLLLRSNHFHGAITSKSTSDSHFPSLKIIDVSHNNLSGPLPSDYFQNWNAMKDFDAKKSPYMDTTINLTLVPGLEYQYIYKYSITVANKGKDLKYAEILDVFTVIDLSSNMFEGDIPECMGSLRGLQVLNLSNNFLTGSIPSSLSNIAQLESLDLSRNKLSGTIPQQLVQLTFLAFFDVSFNHLKGLTPQGGQFSTFGSSSFEGNAGLWGFPLQSFGAPTSPSSPSDSDEDDQDSRSWFELNWITILPGFVGGLIVGVAIEQVLAMDRRAWFIRALKRQ